MSSRLCVIIFAIGAGVGVTSCAPRAPASTDTDTGVDASVDGGVTDTGSRDAGPLDAGSTDANASGLSSSLCEELGEDYAAMSLSCLLGFPAGRALYASEYSCLGLDDLAEEIARGWISLDRDALAACHARWRDATTCNLDAVDALLVEGFRDAPAAIATCPGALVASQEIGEPCRDRRDCIDSDCIVDPLIRPCTGICTAFVRLGQTCSVATPTCEPPLVCTSSFCAPPVEVGDPCALDTSLECELAGGWCDYVAGVCRAWMDADAGEPCGPGLRCTGELRCIPLLDGTNRCDLPSAEGEPCRYSDHCAEPLRCIGSGPPSDVLGTCARASSLGEPCEPAGCVEATRCEAGTCAALATVGSACTWYWSGPGGSDCERSLICDDSTCREPRDLGEVCDDGVGVCAAGWCAAGRCAMRLSHGDPCGADTECRSNDCTSGVCTDTPSCIARDGV